MATADGRELAAFERVDWSEISEPERVRIRWRAFAVTFFAWLGLAIYATVGSDGVTLPIPDPLGARVVWAAPTLLDYAFGAIAITALFTFALPVTEYAHRIKTRVKVFGVLAAGLAVAFVYDHYYLHPDPSFDSVDIPYYGYLYWDIYGVEWVLILSLLIFGFFVVGRLFDDPKKTKRLLTRLRNHPTGAIALAYVTFFTLGGAIGNSIVGMPGTYEMIDGEARTFAHQPPVSFATPVGRIDIFTLLVALTIALGIVVMLYNRVERIQRDRLRLAVTAAVVGVTSVLMVRFVMYNFLEFSAAMGKASAAECAGTYTSNGCLGTWQYPLGTNYVGKGVLKLLFVGFRVSLEVALITSMIMLPIATIVGTFAGYRGGMLDDTITGYIDIQQTIPAFVAYIVLSYVFGRSLFLLILIFGLLSWGGAARLVRSEVVQRREAEFVTAARSAGADDRRIMITHILPNVSNTVLTSVTRRIPMLILAEAAISYLNLNKIMVISLGEAINNGLQYFPRAWWVSTELTLALALVVLAFSLLGDALRDILDPRGDT
jgi:ABC-type dipeptide/oligopeptide/nickel transport system permease subunit